MSSTRPDDPAKVLLVPASLYGEVSRFADRLERTRAEAAVKTTPAADPTDERPADATDFTELDDCPRQ